jgi:hypothetical protein
MEQKVGLGFVDVAQEAEVVENYFLGWKLTIFEIRFASFWVHIMHNN